MASPKVSPIIRANKSPNNSLPVAATLASPNKLSPTRTSFDREGFVMESPDSRSPSLSPRSPKSPLFKIGRSGEGAHPARSRTEPALASQPAGLSREQAYALGRNHLKGKCGLERDHAKAFHFLSLASGFHKAQVHLGAMYEYGLVPGHEPDVSEAVEWYDRAADQSNAKAMCQLGALYDTQNPILAFRYFETSARLGDRFAQYNLAGNYRHGIAVDQDQSEAARWYAKAAAQGEADAQYELGICLDTGRGLAVDRVEALEWMMKAAGRNHRDAQFEIAEAYRDDQGHGVVQHNPAQALKWYRKAAGQGHVMAQDWQARLEAALHTTPGGAALPGMPTMPPTHTTSTMRTTPRMPTISTISTMPTVTVTSASNRSRTEIGGHAQMPATPGSGADQLSQ